MIDERQGVRVLEGEGLAARDRSRRRLGVRLLVAAICASLLAGVGWFSWNLHREYLILNCEAQTLGQLRSSLGAPDSEYERDGHTCWRYTWAWGESSWCSHDGWRVGRGWTFIE